MGGCTTHSRAQGPNYARLVGQESGFAPYPVWSTDDTPAQDGSGDPLGPLFVPAEADTPVAANDAWFWKPNQVLCHGTARLQTLAHRWSCAPRTAVRVHLRTHMLPALTAGGVWHEHHLHF